jgi:hypothetical protein
MLPLSLEKFQEKILRTGVSRNLMKKYSLPPIADHQEKGLSTDLSSKKIHLLIDSCLFATKKVMFEYMKNDDLLLDSIQY